MALWRSTNSASTSASGQPYKRLEASCAALPLPVYIGGCAKVAIAGNQLDEQITKFVLGYLKDHTITEYDEPWTGEERLSEIDTKIAELMHEYRAGGMSAGLIFPEIRKLEGEQRQLQADKGKHTRKRKRATTITGEWPDWDVEERRAVIRSVLEAVVIRPSGRTGVYDPNRAVLVYAE